MEYQRAWHAAHPEKRAEYMARYRLSHPKMYADYNQVRRDRTPRNPRYAIDLSGQTLGRLTVLGRLPGTRTGLWAAWCQCGNFAAIQTRHRGTQSCGCLRREAATVRPAHGQSVAESGRPTAEYAAWRSAIKRCHNPTGQHYKDYGARGIVVCEEWRTDFPAFLAHVGQRPPDVNERGWPTYSLDRIDVDGNYEPGNVRWATAKEQSLNQRPRRAADLAAAKLRIAELEQENAELRRRLAA